MEREGVHGSALLAADPAPRLQRIARVLRVILLLLPIALALLPWQQNLRGSGRVVAFGPLDRQQVVEAPVDGRILKCHVQEGSVVAAGDRLVELADNDPDLARRLEEQRDAARSRIRAAQARVEGLEAQVGVLEESRKLALRIAAERLAMSRERLAASEQARVGATAARETARLNHVRQSALAKEGLASRREFELADLALAQADVEVKRTGAAEAAAQAEVNALVQEAERVGREEEARIRTAGAARDTARGDLAAAEADLLRVEVQVARQKTQVILAPRPGTVFRVSAAEGNYLKAGAPVVTLVPASDARAAEIWVAGNDAPLIQPGRPVRLQFEGWPAVQFVGWPSVAVGTFGGIVSLVDATDDGHGRFRVLVTPDPRDAPWPAYPYLRQGVRARGWVLLDRVSLGFEIWRQLNGFPPSIEMPKDGLPATQGKNGA
jgi:adhesin transport system membrane fusion protein